MAIELEQINVRKALEIRASLETMVRFVLPRLMALDLEWYVRVTEKVAGRTRESLPDSTVLQEAMMGTVDGLRELAIAALAFQRAVKRIYPPGDATFAPGGARGVRP